MGEQEAEFLEFGEDAFAGLPFRGELHSSENGAGLTIKRRSGGIEKSRVRMGGNAAKQKGLDVDWAKTGGPGETLEATGDVGRVSQLAATVTGEKYGIWHD